MVHPEQSSKDRRWFLGAAGKTMAAAFGLAAVGAVATPAYAERGVHQKGQGKTNARGETQLVSYRCCLACDTCGCSECPTNRTKYYCRPNDPNCAPFCTTCRTNIGNCYNITSGC